MDRSTKIAWLTWLLLWPLASHAAGVEVPELGIRFASLPAGVSSPELSAAPGARQLTIRLGTAVLDISRDNEPAPASGDVASPDYRATLDARFDASVESKLAGAPTAVGGRGAWTVVDARPVTGSPPDASAATAYTCVTYVIVDQHLYRMLVSAAGTHRPAEFDALVQALAGITFEPAAAGAAAAAHGP